MHTFMNATRTSPQDEYIPACFYISAEDATDRETVPDTSLTSYNFLTCVRSRFFSSSPLESQRDSKGSKRERRVNRPFVSPGTFEASFAGQTARGSVLPFNLSSSPPTKRRVHGGREEGREEGRRCRRFLFAPQWRAGSFLPVPGPLTSALLLLANCDAADTLVMFLPLPWGSFHLRPLTPYLGPGPYSAHWA